MEQQNQPEPQTQEMQQATAQEPAMQQMPLVNKKHKAIPLLVGLIALLFIATGAFAFLFFNERSDDGAAPVMSEKGTQDQNLVSQPEQQQKTDSGRFVNYEDQKSQVSFKYPEEWGEAIVELTEQDFTATGETYQVRFMNNSLVGAAFTTKDWDAVGGRDGGNGLPTISFYSSLDDFKKFRTTSIEEISVASGSNTLVFAECRSENALGAPTGLVYAQLEGIKTFDDSSDYASVVATIQQPFGTVFYDAKADDPEQDASDKYELVCQAIESSLKDRNATVFTQTDIDYFVAFIESFEM
jgi:hypothetical protein